MKLEIKGRMRAVEGLQMELTATTGIVKDKLKGEEKKGEKEKTRR